MARRLTPLPAAELAAVLDRLEEAGRLTELPPEPDAPERAAKRYQLSG